MALSKESNQAMVNVLLLEPVVVNNLPNQVANVKYAAEEEGGGIIFQVMERSLS